MENQAMDEYTACIDVTIPLDFYNKLFASYIKFNQIAQTAWDGANEFQIGQVAKTVLGIREEGGKP